MKAFTAILSVFLIFALSLLLLSSVSVTAAEEGGLLLTMEANSPLSLCATVHLPVLPLPVKELCGFLPFFLLDALTAAGEATTSLFTLLSRLCE